MKTYNTSDFSPIHPPEDKPVHIGYYPSRKKVALNELEYRYINGVIDVVAYCFWWNGLIWMFDPEDYEEITQERYWFGLNKKP